MTDKHVNRYEVCYRRTPTGKTFTQTITANSLKQAVTLVEEMSPDTYEIFFVVKVLA
jgi:hypothetical protein